MSAHLLPDQVTRVVERAGLAPSIHNTQPWRFRSSGDTIEVWADRSRQLRSIDPTGRQLAVSVGAAVEFARLALRAEGYDVSCSLLPIAEQCDLMATLTPVRPLAVDGATRALVHCMPRRSTYRDAFDPRPVSAAVVTRLREAVHGTGCATMRLSREQMPALIALLGRAESAELGHPDYVRELALWRSPAADAVDGVPDAALPTRRNRVSRLPLRRFDPDPVPHLETPAVDDPVLLLVSTDGDDAHDWLTSGRALAQLLLRSTVAGLQASPVTHSLDAPLDRQRTARLLGSIGHVQLIVRLGYGTATPTTPRRPVSEILDLSARR